MNQQSTGNGAGQAQNEATTKKFESLYICPYHRDQPIIYICLDNSCHEKLLCKQCYKFNQEHNIISIQLFFERLEEYTVKKSMFDKNLMPIVEGSSLKDKLNLFMNQIQNERKVISQQHLTRFDNIIQKMQSSINDQIIGYQQQIKTLYQEKLDEELSQESLKRKDYKDRAANIILGIFKKNNYSQLNNYLIQLHDGKIELGLAKEKVILMIDQVIQKIESLSTTLINHVRQQLNNISTIFNELEKKTQKKLSFLVNNQKFQSILALRLTKKKLDEGGGESPQGGGGTSRIAGEPRSMLRLQTMASTSQLPIKNLRNDASDERSPKQFETTRFHRMSYNNLNFKKIQSQQNITQDEQQHSSQTSRPQTQILNNRKQRDIQNFSSIAQSSNVFFNESFQHQIAPASENSGLQKGFFQRLQKSSGNIKTKERVSIIEQDVNPFLVDGVNNHGGNDNQSTLITQQKFTGVVADIINLGNSRYVIGFLEGMMQPLVIEMAQEPYDNVTFRTESSFQGHRKLFFFSPCKTPGLFFSVGLRANNILSAKLWICLSEKNLADLCEFAELHQNQIVGLTCLHEELGQTQNSIVFASCALKEPIKVWLITSSSLQFHTGTSTIKNLMKINESLKIDKIFCDYVNVYAHNFGEIIKFKFNSHFDEMTDLRVVRAPLQGKDIVVQTVVVEKQIIAATQQGLLLIYAVDYLKLQKTINFRDTFVSNFNFKEINIIDSFYSTSKSIYLIVNKSQELLIYEYNFEKNQAEVDFSVHYQPITHILNSNRLFITIEETNKVRVFKKIM